MVALQEESSSVEDFKNRFAEISIKSWSLKRSSPREADAGSERPLMSQGVPSPLAYTEAARSHRTLSKTSSRVGRISPSATTASESSFARDKSEYGGPPSTILGTPVASAVAQRVIRPTPPTQHRSWSGIWEIVFNCLGTLGFIVGSALWAGGLGTTGTLLFAASCLSCGISCCIYTVSFVKMADYVGVYALQQQATGCWVFTIGSFLFINPNCTTIGLIAFFAASLLFQTGCLLTQVQSLSFTGVSAPIWPYFRKGGRLTQIPTSLCNSIGSAFFILGSIALFYDNWGQIAGAWLYLVGSVFFFAAAWGDATLWWESGLTQSEQPQVCVLERGLTVKVT